MTIVGLFDVFIDHDYHSMWCIRRVGDTQVIPFITRAEAERAALIISKWLETK